LKIRKSEEPDLSAILNIQLEAFGNTEGPEVATLVTDLFCDPTATPLLSLVAIHNNQIIGHALFTRSQVSGSDKQISSVILAPLAVIPSRQGQGVGSQLIKAGMEFLSETGIELVFVLGHPGYYPRHGFRPAGTLGFEAPYPIPTKNAEAWMVKELVSGALDSAKGRVLCSEAMDKPEYWRE